MFLNKCKLKLLVADRSVSRDIPLPIEGNEKLKKRSV